LAVQRWLYGALPRGEVWKKLIWVQLLPSTKQRGKKGSIQNRFGDVRLGRGLNLSQKKVKSELWGQSYVHFSFAFCFFYFGSTAYHVLWHSTFAKFPLSARRAAMVPASIM
jgi:hypothetical protein